MGDKNNSLQRGANGSALTKQESFKVLVLGVETATPQVGVAIGGHEGVIASFHTARDRRHAETLAPAIEFYAIKQRSTYKKLVSWLSTSAPDCSRVCASDLQQPNR